MARSRDDEFGAPLPPLLCNPQMLDVVEVKNGILLAEYIRSAAEEWHDQYRFTPDLVRHCNRIAMDGIYGCAGEYRDRCVTVDDFVGQHHRDIPWLVEEMCDYANSRHADPIHAAAYLLWRTNWIHPFYDGNGRVSRELSYLAILTGLGLPHLGGEHPIPELLDRECNRYMSCLRAADIDTSRDGQVNVRRLESLLCELLDEQSA